MPRVSVVIPLYNKAKYIGRALDSVLGQTFRDIEVIVVDDGSTDDGPGIVGRYGDARLRLIRQVNAGPGAARNRGLKESTSPLVAFLDADDEWMPTYLERTVGILCDDSDCAAVGSAYFRGAERTDVVSTFRKSGMTDGRWSVDRCRRRRDLWSTVYALHSSTTTARREVLLRYGGFYEKNRCKYGEDYYLWTQVAFGHDIYRLLEPLVWYHTEASELAVGPPSELPLQPVLTDPEPIRRTCPPGRRKLLEKWLAQFALAVAHNLSASGDASRAEWLVDAFPLMKRMRWEYLKLWVKLTAPSLVPCVRASKRLAQNFVSR